MKRTSSLTFLSMFVEQIAQETKFFPRLLSFSISGSLNRLIDCHLSIPKSWAESRLRYASQLIVKISSKSFFITFLIFPFALFSPSFSSLFPFSWLKYCHMFVMIKRKRNFLRASLKRRAMNHQKNNKNYSNCHPITAYAWGRQKLFAYYRAREREREENFSFDLMSVNTFPSLSGWKNNAVGRKNVMR